MTDKTGAEIDQAQMVQVRNVLHAAGECHSHETERDVARILRERDELRAVNKVLRLRGDIYLEQLQQKHAEIERLRAALEWVRDDTELWDAPIVLEALGDAGAQG